MHFIHSTLKKQRLTDSGAKQQSGNSMVRVKKTRPQPQSVQKLMDDFRDDFKHEHDAANLLSADTKQQQ